MRQATRNKTQATVEQTTHPAGTRRINVANNYRADGFAINPLCFTYCIQF
jgi:hypothetical protein